MISRILLVEDEPAIRDGVATCLRLKGFEVATAETLARAREHLSSGLSFDAAITDWKLPDGEVELLRDDLRSMRWIVVSGQSASLHARLPEARILSKPAAIGDLLRAVTEERKEAEPVGKPETTGTAVRHRRLRAAVGRFERLCLGGADREVDDAELILGGRVRDAAALKALVAEVGGDLRPGRDRVEWRLSVDGRPQDARRVVPGALPGIEPGPRFWLDFDVERPDAAELAEFRAWIAEARACGCRLVRTDDLPDWLAVEEPGDLPETSLSVGIESTLIGPSLPRELDLLWGP